MDEQEKALRARAEAQVGTMLMGKYRLDRVLGSGGMATVFAATHRNQAEFAVKILHSELSLREDLRKRFLREGYVANSVKHPGAVMVVDDAVAEDGSAFLVMELLRGATVEALWEDTGRRMPSRAVASIALQLLDVLVAAHEKAIVHRDLKPANLFVTLDGTLKVLDFGIARLRDSLSANDHATRTGVLMGTPAFMAPEQAQAVAKEIDGQTDVWAVGATMFTLLTGELVHEGSNSSQLLIQAGTARARPIGVVMPKLEPSIAAIVDRALVFEKAERWPSALKMREALALAISECFGATASRDTLLELLPAGPRMSVRFTAETEPPNAERFGTTTGPRRPSGGLVTPPHDPPAGSTQLSHSHASQGSHASHGSTGRTSKSPPAIQPPLQGMSTGSPVSSGAATHAPMGGKVVTASAVVVAIGALLFAFQSRGKTTVVVAAPPIAPTASTPAALAKGSVPPPGPPAVATTATTSQPPSPLGSSPGPASAPALATPTPTKARPAPVHALTPASTSASAKPSEPARDCSIAPYWYDAKGDKHWYPECQR